MTVCTVTVRSSHLLPRVLPSWNAARNRKRPLKYTPCDRKLESANSNSAALTRLRTSNQGVALARLEPFPPAQMNAR